MGVLVHQGRQAQQSRSAAAVGSAQCLWSEPCDVTCLACFVRCDFCHGCLSHVLLLTFLCCFKPHLHLQLPGAHTHTG